MTDKQPKALVLADELEVHDGLFVAHPAAAELRRQHEAIEKLEAAVQRLHKAKGRYHTQLAVCDLFDLVGLPNERPKK